MQQNECAKRLREVDKLAHAKEFGTIKICGPRQSGHTSSIIRFIIEQIKLCRNKKFAIVFPNQSMLERIQNVLLQKIYDQSNIKIDKYNGRYIDFQNGNKIYLWTMRQIENRTENPTKHTYNEEQINLDYIIVDCASFMNEKTKKEIYNVGIEAMKYKEYVAFMFFE
jgi:hypothetical protein